MSCRAAEEIEDWPAQPRSRGRARPIAPLPRFRARKHVDVRSLAAITQRLVSDARRWTLLTCAPKSGVPEAQVVFALFSWQPVRRQMSSTSRSDRARPTQIIIVFPARRSSSLNKVSRWSGAPSKTAVSHVPQ
jgi:hypothetical protein